MSKKRGMSADEKTKALQDLYLEEVGRNRKTEKKKKKNFFSNNSRLITIFDIFKVTVWNLKELEKVAPKKKGIGESPDTRTWKKKARKN